MKAYYLNSPGDVSQLQIYNAAIPEIQPTEILVQVKAIGINPVDVKTRSGKGIYGRIKCQNPLILGWDISGVVMQSKTTAFSIGDEVFGMVNFPGHGQAYAEYVAAPVSQLALKPGNISHEEAAAASLAALTAWQALVKHAQVQPGQKVLIQAAAGGVGHFAVQIAKHLGAQVTGTSSAKNEAFIRQLGADAHIDYTNYDWANHPEKFDFVLDGVGGSAIDHSLLMIKPGGTLISIPTGLNEAVTEKAKLQGVNGYFILVQSDGADMQQIADLLKKGSIRSHVSAVFPFEQMTTAHSQVESGHTVGKVVVKI
ncbi:NADP-dependent oxidoreductase [Dyadobacter sp. LJ53]|uniref:NADP-dependent oxidoreductase n=1 Tax=Dyadobacter chenwenxiniae TaxID=2906456 RepID=UPI001F2AE607|nr:NADP-dependent oxidoreductase [Dyadobacter chenwenxiniae]MCF0048947.1 NADP-dependent oxidoreductase [Dyadobacter chenwenxiniae]